MANRFLIDDRNCSKRKTKIVTTIGPATKTPEKLKELILAGANVFRLNFSHGTHSEHLEILQNIRNVSGELQCPVAVLQDLGGPKIRITKVEGDAFAIPDGGTVELRASIGSLGKPGILYTETIDPTKILSPGQHVLLADGIITMVVESVSKEGVKCKVIQGGRIRSRVGIAFPDSVLDIAATTDKDLVDLEWAIDNDLDYVAISFVKNAKDILRVRDLINRKKGDIKIISKIERRDALENITEILDISDGVMVARGDLGVEVPLEKVPMIQKALIEQANYRGIPVIVATQMLHSMITSVRPTRAEVSDIATAVMTGADALMLSEETAIGENPVESVKYLGRIAFESERSFVFEEFKLRLREADRLSVPDAVAYAACAAAVKINASAIVACTETGTSARLVAKYRPQQPLYGTSSHEKTLRRMCLYWGVIPISCSTSTSHQDEVELALRTVQTRENLPNGSRAVTTGGIAVHTPGATSVLDIREMNFR